MKGKHDMLRIGLIAFFATPVAAQETMPLSDLMAATHVHGIGPGAGGADSLTLATHNGLWAVDLTSDTATRLGQSQGGFMGFSRCLTAPAWPMPAAAP